MDLRKELTVMRNNFKQLPQEIQEGLMRNLMCAVLHEAIIDYSGLTPVSVKKVMSPSRFDQKVILKDLHHPLVVALSNGMSETIATMLQENPERIKQNLKEMGEKEDVCK